MVALPVLGGKDSVKHPRHYVGFECVWAHAMCTVHTT